MTGYMHDWTLLSVKVDWIKGEAAIDFRALSGHISVHAVGLSEVHIPRHFPWGRSESVNSVKGPSLAENSEAHLSIEMQSGDVIRISARSFVMPEQP